MNSYSVRTNTFKLSFKFSRFSSEKSKSAQVLHTNHFHRREFATEAVFSYTEFYLHERNHQGLENTIPFPDVSVGSFEGKIKRKERLGGLLKYYYREAA